MGTNQCFFRYLVESKCITASAIFDSDQVDLSREGDSTKQKLWELLTIEPGDCYTELEVTKIVNSDHHTYPFMEREGGGTSSCS